MLNKNIFLCIILFFLFPVALWLCFFFYLFIKIYLVNEYLSLNGDQVFGKFKGATCKHAHIRK